MHRSKGKPSYHCAFPGCTNNSRFTPSEIKYHPFTKPCLKVSKGVEQVTESHLSQCSTCTKCNRWILSGQGTKKWPKSLKEIKRSHYLCSSHFVYGHPHSDRFPDPLPAISALELRNKMKVLQDNVHPAKRRNVFTKNDQSQILSDINNTTGIEYFMMLPIGFKTCELPIENSQFLNGHNSTLPKLAAKTIYNNNMTSRSQQTTFVWKDIQKLKEENQQLLLENIALKKRVHQLEEERNRRDLPCNKSEPFCYNKDMEHKLLHNLLAATPNSLHEPLSKVDVEEAVGDLHIKQEIVERTIDHMAYNGFNIKQEETDIKDELPVVPVHGNLTDESFLSKACKSKTPQKSNLVNYATMIGSSIKGIGRRTGEKPYSCASCYYTTVKKYDLVKHMRKHTGKKPYASFICDYKAAKKST